MVQIDTDYEDWKVGDTIKWIEEKDNTVVYHITRINHDHDYVYWNDPLSGEENMTRAINLRRVKWNIATNDA